MFYSRFDVEADGVFGDLSEFVALEYM